jgi:hypothetical protein
MKYKNYNNLIKIININILLVKIVKNNYKLLLKLEINKLKDLFNY